MKKLLFLCFSLISTLCFSQIGQVVFQKPEFSGGESAGPMVELNNGYLLYTINTPNLGDSKMNVIVHKLDQAGNIIESHSYGGPGYENVVSATKTINGDVYFAGSSTVTNDDIHCFYLMKFDQNGNFQWQNRFTRPNDELCTSIITMTNGNLLLSGSTHTSLNNTDIKNICISPAGNVLWEKSWAFEQSQSVEDALCIPNGNIYLVINTYVFPSYLISSEIFSLDLNGDTLWIKKFPYGISNRKILKCIEYLPTSSKLLIGGSYYKDRYYLGKFDLDGTELSSSFVPYVTDYIRKLKYVSDTLIYALGEYKRTNSTSFDELQSNSLFTVDSSFNFKDTAYFGFPNISMTTAINSMFFSNNQKLYLPTTISNLFTIDSTADIRESNAAFLSIINPDGLPNLDSISITNGNSLTGCQVDSIHAIAPIGFDKYIWEIGDDQLITTEQNELKILPKNYYSRFTVSVVAFKKNRIYYSNSLTFIRSFSPTDFVRSTDTYVNFCKLDLNLYTDPNMHSSYNVYPGNTYQWYRNDTVLSGDTTEFLQWPSQDGRFFAIVQNQCGIDTTANFFVNSSSQDLDDLPDTIISSSINGQACNTIQLAPSYSQRVGHYQWFWNGQILLTDTLYYLNTSDSGSYFCTLQNSCGIDTTNICTILMNDNDSINFNIVIDSVNCQNYWQEIEVSTSNNSNPIAYSDNNLPYDYFVNNGAIKFRLRGSGNYYFKTSSIYCGNSTYIYSDTISINIDPNSGPILSPFTPHNTPINVGPGDSTELSVSCAGPGFTYQWFNSLYGYTPYLPVNNNGNSQTYWAKPSFSNSSPYYFCKVYNPICGTFQNSDTIAIRPPQVFINYTYSVEHDCSNQLLRISNGSNSCCYSPIIKYNWYRDNILVHSSTIDTVLWATIPGNYSCTVYFTLNDSIHTLNEFKVYNREDFSIASTSICGNESIVLIGDTTLTHNIYWHKSPSNYYIGKSDSITINTPGDYLASYELPYCSIYSNPIHIIKNPASSTEIFSTNNQICNGSIAPLTLGSNLPAGCQFQWYRDNLLLPGASTNSYSATIPGEYKVRITNGTCIDFTGNYTVYANSLNSSQIFSNAQNLICNGGTSILQTAIPSGTFQWYHNTILLPGANQSTYTANTTGIYSCNVTDANGCQGTGAISVINGSTLPFTVASNAPTSICAPSLSQLHLSPLYNNQTYQWYRDNIIINGATNYTYNTLDTGNYFCAINNICGIQYSDTLSIIQTPKARALQPGFHHTPVCVNTPAVLGGNPFAGATTYQWTLPASLHPLSGITSNYLVFQADNSFFSENVILKAFNICNVISDESESIVLTRNYNCPPVYDPTQNTRIRDSGTIDIFPNPTQNNFTIRLNGEELQSIQIINSIGEILRVYIQPKSDILFGDELPQGIYFIKFTGSDRNEVETVVKM